MIPLTLNHGLALVSVCVSAMSVYEGVGFWSDAGLSSDSLLAGWLPSSLIGRRISEVQVLTSKWTMVPRCKRCSFLLCLSFFGNLGGTRDGIARGDTAGRSHKGW